MNQNNTLIIGTVIGLVLALAVVGWFGYNQVYGDAAITATPTPTKTPEAEAIADAPQQATREPTPTATSTSTPLPATITVTPTPTQLIINEPMGAAQPTFDPNVTPEPLLITSEVVITDTEGVTRTETITATATPRPTPLPRTVQVPKNIPNPGEVNDHFWFRRPYTDNTGRGSYYYPYGTNAQGQYFWHFGIDIPGEQGRPVVAVGDGVVVHAGPDDVNNILGPWPDFYGQAVVVQHEMWNGQAVYTLYGHVSETLVNVGQEVDAGQPIAEVGQLGVALGPHLHLEVRLGANTYQDTRNPDFWVAPDFGNGIIAGRVVDHQGYFVPVQLVTLHRTEDGGRFWRQTYTYPDNQVNYDDQYVENFTFSDVPAGEYELKTFFDGYQMTVPITVEEGETAFAVMKQINPPRIGTGPAAAPISAVVREGQEEIVGGETAPAEGTAGSNGLLPDINSLDVVEGESLR